MPYDGHGIFLRRISNRCFRCPLQIFPLLNAQKRPWALEFVLFHAHGPLGVLEDPMLHLPWASGGPKRGRLKGRYVNCKATDAKTIVIVWRCRQLGLSLSKYQMRVMHLFVSRDANLSLLYFLYSEQITRTISAHEQHPVGPWLRTFPKKVGQASRCCRAFILRRRTKRNHYRLSVAIRSSSVLLLTLFG